jgi:hypothetical protein
LREIGEIVDVGSQRHGRREPSTPDSFAAERHSHVESDARKPAMIRPTPVPPPSRAFPVALVVLAGLASIAACKRRTDEDHISTPERRKPVSPSVLPAKPSSAVLPPAMPGCEEDNRQIYVVSQESDLYRFPPLSKSFTKIGHLDCPASAGTQPFSMAVDRTGVAWILYQDGNVFRASTRDAHCVATKYTPGQQGMRTFGMAFVTDGPGSAHDTLYLADDSMAPRGLATLDVATFDVSPIKSYDAGSFDVGRFDLTGTGDGRIFGFDAKPPAHIVEIDPKSAKIVASKSIGSIGDRAWAIAQYWGAFYVFSATYGHSQVLKFTWNTGVEEEISSDIGFTVVGAGVSSCAPTLL